MRASLRTWLTGLLTDETERDLVEPHLVPVAEVELHLPIEVADYVDFYASLEHATNVGKMFRPDAEALLPNWRHLPVGYHGRAGTVVPSGTESCARRASGRRRTHDAPTFGPRPRLDIEAELGFVVGTAVGAGRAGRRRPVRRPRLRRRRPQRLARARHPGVGVRAAGAVPRQVVRDLDLPLGDPARGARRGVGRPAGPGPGAAALPLAPAAAGPRHRRRGRCSTARSSAGRRTPRCTGRRRRCWPT